MKLNKKIFLILLKSALIMGSIESPKRKIITSRSNAELINSILTKDIDTYGRLSSYLDLPRDLLAYTDFQTTQAERTNLARFISENASNGELISRLICLITAKSAHFAISDLVKQSLPQIIESCENYKDIIKLLISTDSKNQLKIFRSISLNIDNSETFKKILIEILSKLNLLDRTYLENEEKINNLLLLFSNYDSEILLRALEIRKKSKKPLRQSELQELIKITIQSSNAQLLQYIFQEFTNINSIIFKTNIIEEWLLNPQTDILEILLNQVRFTDQKTQDKILQTLELSIIERESIEQFNLLKKYNEKLFFKKLFYYTKIATSKRSINLYNEILNNLRQIDPNNPEIVNFLLSLVSVDDINFLNEIFNIFDNQIRSLRTNNICLVEELFIQSILNNNINLVIFITLNYKNFLTNALKNNLNYLELACTVPKSGKTIRFFLDQFPDLEITKTKTKRLFCMQLIESFSANNCKYLFVNKNKFCKFLELKPIFFEVLNNVFDKIDESEFTDKILNLAVFFGLDDYLTLIQTKNEVLFNKVISHINLNYDNLNEYLTDLDVIALATYILP